MRFLYFEFHHLRQINAQLFEIQFAQHCFFSAAVLKSRQAPLCATKAFHSFLATGSVFFVLRRAAIFLVSSWTFLSALQVLEGVESLSGAELDRLKVGLVALVLLEAFAKKGVFSQQSLSSAAWKPMQAVRLLTRCCHSFLAFEFVFFVSRRAAIPLVMSLISFSGSQDIFATFLASFLALLAK